MVQYFVIWASHLRVIKVWNRDMVIQWRQRRHHLLYKSALVQITDNFNLAKRFSTTYIHDAKKKNSISEKSATHCFIIILPLELMVFGFSRESTTNGSFFRFLSVCLILSTLVFFSVLSIFLSPKLMIYFIYKRPWLVIYFKKNTVLFMTLPQPLTLFIPSFLHTLPCLVFSFSAAVKRVSG